MIANCFASRVVFVFTLLFICASNCCEAQMFGARSTGRPLSRQTAPGTPGSTGTIQGGERFIRGNRGAGDFVGNSALDRTRFVGLINAQNQIMLPDSAVTSATRADRGPQINTPIKTRAINTLYEPVLELGFAPEIESTERLSLQAQTRIDQAFSLRFGNQISALVEVRTAILRGEVGAAEDSRLAEVMASMEPGISVVQNELTIRPLAETSEGESSPMNRSR